MIWVNLFRFNKNSPPKNTFSSVRQFGQSAIFLTAKRALRREFRLKFATYSTKRFACRVPQTISHMSSNEATRFAGHDPARGPVGSCGSQKLADRVVSDQEEVIETSRAS